MQFVNAARAKVKELDAHDPLRVVLDFMLKHGVGVQNAKSWPKIEAHLKERGVRLSWNKFQHTLLQQTREGDIFIGSTDRRPGAGYFLIADRGDAGTAREFYRRRIEDMQVNLNNLERLIALEWTPNETAG